MDRIIRVVEHWIVVSEVMGSILIAIHNQRVLTYMYIYVLTRLFAALFLVDFFFKSLNICILLQPHNGPGSVTIYCVQQIRIN